MVYDNQNAAYDLELFKDNTARELPKRKTSDRKKVNEKNNKTVLEMSQEDVYKSRKRKHNPFKLFVGGVCVAVIVVVISTIIVGQVQLTELNQKIITAQQTLADTKSEYTQLQMAVQSKLSTSEIESYAEKTLGMSKVENAQKEFVSLSEGDKAEISGDGNLNFFQKVIRAITRSWS